MDPVDFGVTVFFNFRAAILRPTRCQQPWLFHKRFKLQMRFNYFLSSTKLQMNMTLAYWQIPKKAISTHFEGLTRQVQVVTSKIPWLSHKNSLFEQAFWRLTPLGFIMSDLSPSWGEWLGVSLPPLDGLAFWSWLWPNRCRGDCWWGVFFCVFVWKLEDLSHVSLVHEIWRMPAVTSHQPPLKGTWSKRWRLNISCASHLWFCMIRCHWKKESEMEVTLPSTVYIYIILLE